MECEGTAMAEREALVIFDSRYGNTARIAQALARGLQQVEGIEARLGYAPDVGSELLENAQFLLMGGPTEYFTASSHIKEFFARCGAFNLRGKFGFAFDTHAHARVSGSAARYIEKELKAMGVHLLEPRESAWTEVHPRAPGAGGLTAKPVELAPGMEKKFEEIGTSLGREFLTAFAAQLAEPERKESTA